MAERITEEMHLEKEWFDQASKQTLKTLPDYVNHLMNDYEHDYGTVCHAVAACAIAAAWAANNEPNGGITGFQAGFVMWDFIKQWSFPNNKTGLKIIDYDDMLYPQYAYKFYKTLSEDTWRELQGKAKKLLAEKGDDVHPLVMEHWKSIAAGVIPFGYSIIEEKE